VALGSGGTQSVLMNNPGAGSITISQANIAGNEFSMSGLSLPLVLTAGQSRTFSVAFTPSSAGTVDGSLSFLSTATNSPTVQALSGTGTHGFKVVRRSDHPPFGRGDRVGEPDPQSPAELVRRRRA
jgi:hypothetical protein